MSYEITPNFSAVDDARAERIITLLEAMEVGHLPDVPYVRAGLDRLAVRLQLDADNAELQARMDRQASVPDGLSAETDC